jgi:hypothetical protein
VNITETVGEKWIELQPRQNGEPVSGQVRIMVATYGMQKGLEHGTWREKSWRGEVQRDREEE